MNFQIAYKFSKFFIVLYLFFLVFAFFYLFQSYANSRAFSPWQIIHPFYIYFFAAATFVLGVLIFSKIRLWIILALLIAHSFLLHSYLPLTHNLLYGADQWRHMANEQRIVNGLPYLEAKLLTANNVASSQLSIGKWKFDIGKLSYSIFWQFSAVIAKIAKLNLIAINKWLVPILWSLFFPLLLYKFGRVLDWGEQKSLLLVWLSFLPFALQAAGSFTLPVNLGFLPWLLFIILIIKRLKDQRRWQIPVLFIIGIFSVFGYSLYFILFWQFWIVGEILKIKIKNVEMGTKSCSHGEKIKISILVVFVILFVCALELMFGYSYFVKVNWLAQIKQIVGNFLAWYVAFGPRPHDILTGNIIINQVPSYAFVVNIFTVSRWWLVVFMLVFWGIVFVGCRQFWRSSFTPYSLLLTLFAGLFGSHIISRYFLGGEQVFSRRLDIILAFLLIIFLTEGLFYWWNKLPELGWKKFLLLASIFVITIGMASSYSLGPDTNTVSTDEYRAMQYVWENEKANKEHCVLADTYPLLALEAVSAKEIIGGGFPIGSTFAQPERVATLNSLLSKPSAEVWHRALDTTGANNCWLVAERSGLKYNEFVRRHEVALINFGDMVVWKYIGESRSLK